MKQVECPECGYKDEPIETTVYGNDDRDGNRGIYLTFVECSNCGADLKEEVEKI